MEKMGMRMERDERNEKEIDELMSNKKKVEKMNYMKFEDES